MRSPYCIYAPPLPEQLHAVSNMDGILRDLPARLSRNLEFDSIALEGLPASKRFTLYFRRKAKMIFHVRLIRRGGRLLVEFGGGDPSVVLRGISICRDHLDAWFGISPEDVSDSIQHSQRNNPV
jgi:hypothetical protein